MFNAVKIFCITLIALFIQSSAQAYGIFWYDMNSDMANWKKVVIFPLANAGDTNKFLIDRDEQSLLYWENKHLMERMEKKIKNMHTVRLAPGIEEKGEILIDKFSVLLNPYPNEKARAAAVFEQTGADMYLIPIFKQNHIQRDVSPRTVVNVEMRTWTEETDGPNGDRTYGETKWTERHVIPEKDIFLNIMELEFVGYDTTDAKKVLTFTDSRRLHPDQAYRGFNFNGKIDVEKHLFRDITKYIRKDFGEIKNTKNKDKGKTGIRSIGFKNLALPSNVGSNEFTLKGAYFAVKDEALDRLKNFKVVTDGNSNEPVDYYVTGSVSNWKMISIWHPPHVTTSSSLVESKETKWTDSKGKEHKMKTKKYKTSITDHFAYWEIKWNVQASFNLVNAKTGEVVLSEYGNETDDKVMDAYRHILSSFYKKVNQKFNV